METLAEKISCLDAIAQCLAVAGLTIVAGLVIVTFGKIVIALIKD